MIEQGPEQTLNNINILLGTFEKVIDHVKGAALIGVLDDIGQLAETLQEQIRDEQICSRLLAILSKKWN